jgi:hypothetical protein
MKRLILSKSNFYIQKKMNPILLYLDDDTQTSTKEAKKVRVDNLNRVYDYCLNNVTCRRTQ